MLNYTEFEASQNCMHPCQNRETVCLSEAMKLGGLWNADWPAAPLMLSTQLHTHLPRGEWRALVGRTSKKNPEKQGWAHDL